MFFWQIYNTTFHEIFMILQQKIFIDTWPFAWVGFNSKEHRHDRANSSVLNKFKKIGNFSLPGFGLKMCIYYPKVTLSLLCVNIVFNFLELFSWLPKTTGNIRPLPLNWLKELGVGIAINFHPSFCVVPPAEIPATMDTVFGYLLHIFW